jgi:hypothetical protein
MLVAMKALVHVLAIAVGLSPALARGDPDAKQHATQQEGDSETSDEEQPTAELATDGTIAPASPRGELVRMARLPEAELMVGVNLVSNDERAYFEVNSDKTGASLLICGTPCRFRIWPGRYRLITNASDSYVGGSNQFVVERDSSVEIVEPHVYRPALGALVGVIGVASAVVGGVLLATSACDSACDSATATRGKIGFATLGAGVVLAPAGWILFAQNRNPELTVNPSKPDNRE